MRDLLWGNFMGTNFLLRHLGGGEFPENCSTEGNFPAYFEKQLEIRKKKSFFKPNRFKNNFACDIVCKRFFGSIFSKDGFVGVVGVDLMR